MMNNKKRRSLGQQYKIGQIAFIERLRAAVMTRSTNDDEDVAWSKDLPSLPPEPQGTEKRVVVIKKREKTS